MLWFWLAQLVVIVLDVLSFYGKLQSDKELEVLVLRQQIRILQRRLDKPPRLSRFEKLILAVLTFRWKNRLHDAKQQLQQSVLIFKPNTVLKWHRELVKRKWTFRHTVQVGRPRIDAELETLIVRLVKDNPRLGYEKLQGELLKLGYQVSVSTVKAVCKRNHLLPAPERTRAGSNWRNFLNHYKSQMLASDFFTVETVLLQTVYVLFFIELHTRQVYIAGCTAHPDSKWVTQQARQQIWTLQDRCSQKRFLIHDRDSKFPAAFDTVFETEGIEIILTPYHAPNANAIAERWVRTVREECLDQLLIVNQAHLRRVLTEYVKYYNAARPHQALHQQAPIPLNRDVKPSPIHCRDVLGGIIHDYYREVA